MNDRKEQLQKAIITNDMDLVRDFYEYIFGEKAPISLKTPSSSDNELKVYKDRMKQAVAILTSSIPPKFDSEDVIVEQKPKKAAKAEASKINEASGMQFISSKDFELPEDSMPNYNKTLEKISKRKKSVREPYRARVVKCDSCGSDFDFNKEYPVGQLESGANAKTKCNRCRSK